MEFSYRNTLKLNRLVVLRATLLSMTCAGIINMCDFMGFLKQVCTLA